MESVYVALMICAIVIFCFALNWTFFNEICDFIAKLAFSLKPFSARAVYKRNVREAKRKCRYNAKILKRLIRNERNQIKEEINNSIGYCYYIDIVFDDNLVWLEKKGFNITDEGLNHRYKISWSDNE